jgi:hypothetical protein
VLGSPLSSDNTSTICRGPFEECDSVRKHGRRQVPSHSPLAEATLASARTRDKLRHLQSHAAARDPPRQFRPEPLFRL